jgi:hypothetical protein
MSRKASEQGGKETMAFSMHVRNKDIKELREDEDITTSVLYSLEQQHALVIIQQKAEDEKQLCSLLLQAGGQQLLDQTMQLFNSTQCNINQNAKCQ